VLRDPSFAHGADVDVLNFSCATPAADHQRDTANGYHNPGGK
jgi:hypothetical protein